MHFQFFQQFPLRTTWPWLVSTALLCFAATAALGDVPALRAHVVDADRKIVLLEATLRSPLTALQVTNQSHEIADRLEAPERLTTVVHDLQDLATQHGIALLAASYKPSDDRGNGQIGKVAVGVRLKGAYQPLKKTIAALLGGHPSLALESLALRRGTSIDAVLEIDLKFTFYYGKRA
jgi:hypothetical protein